VMSEYPSPPPRRADGAPAPREDPEWGRLAGGGIAASLVAALVPVVGLIVVRGVFNVEVFVRHHDGSLVTVSSATYALAGFAAGLLASALMVLLVILRVPAAKRFFAAIVILVTVIAVASPFGTGVGTGSALATAAINAAIGIAILVLLSGVTEVVSRR
jgi:Family of unknown function (DUF6069)